MQFTSKSTVIPRFIKIANYIQDHPYQSIRQIKEKFTQSKCKEIDVIYSVFGKNKEGFNFSLNSQSKQALVYFLYAKDIDNAPNEKIVGKNWQKTKLRPFYGFNLLHEELWPFEIYLIRKGQLPPAFYFDKEYEYKFIAHEIIKYIVKNKIDIMAQLQSFTDKWWHKQLVHCVLLYEIAVARQEKLRELYFVKLYANIVKNDYGCYLTDSINNGIVNLFVNTVKIDGWESQKLIQRNDIKLTPFQYIFIELYGNDCEFSDEEAINAINFDEKFYYDGCLQEKIQYFDYQQLRPDYDYDPVAMEINTDLWLNLTPAQLYIYFKHQLPPEKFCYDGWKQEIVTYNNHDYTMPQFWLVCTQKDVPQELRINGWDNADKKFWFSQHQNNNEIYGNIEQAYAECGLIYKDNSTTIDECCVCLSSAPVYNFCKNKHQSGVCKDCHNNLRNKWRCPICNEKIEKIGGI